MRINSRRGLSFLIFLLCAFSINAQNNDSSYVTPAELEPGWGLYYTTFDTAYFKFYGEYKTNMPMPKTWELMGFQVSPNGKYLAFTNNSNNTKYYNWFGLKVLNLETKKIITIDKYGWCPMWTSDSKALYYQMIAGIEPANSRAWYPETNRIDTICFPIIQNKSCRIGQYLGPDNCLYFVATDNYPNKDSLLYRTNLDSTLKYGFAYNESITGTAGFEWYAPLFPPEDLNYTLRQFWAKGGGSVAGFYFVKNFDARNSLAKYIKIPDTSWVYCTMNTDQWGWGSMVIGPRGDLYAWLSFRPKSIVGSDGMFGYDVGPFDSAEIAARNASGLYKLDTSGGNLVQLVRSWSYNPGGFDEKNPAVSITADGETIYYGFLQPDTCISIMRMNRFGKQKELIYKLEPIITSVFVDGSPISDDNFCSIRQSNNELKIILKKNDLSFHFSIYNLLGNKIKEFISEPGENVLTIDKSDFNSGIYFLVYSSSKYNGAVKFLIYF